jgi:hypothetical protein
MRILNDDRFDYKIILIIVLSIVISRWFFLFYSFQESIENYIIFSVEDFLYFPFVINLSEINFKPDYLKAGLISGMLPIPTYSIIVHSLLYKIIGSYSFLVLELFFFFAFIYLLVKIFQEIGFDLYQTIIALLILIIFLSINSYLKLFYNFPYLSILNLFEYRFPRPLVTSSFFLLGFLFILKFYKIRQKSLFFIYLGIIFAINFSSMIYNFIILSTLFLIIFIKKNIDNKFNNILEESKKIMLTAIFFLFFSSPFLFTYFFSEKDYLGRIGIIDLDFDQKFYLLKYILIKLSSIQFLTAFIFLNLLYFFLRKKYFFEKKILNFIYIYFLSSILSLILFVIVTPAITEIYHLINLVAMTMILVILIFLVMVLIILFNNYFPNLLRKNIIFLLFFNLFFIILINFFIFSNIKNKDLNFRKDLILLNMYLSKISNLDSLLTFNTKLQVWWLLKNKKYLKSVDSIISPEKDLSLEENFFQNMIFLKVPPSNFDIMLKNNKIGWRYNNDLVKYLSFYKYQANSLVTFNNSIDFDSDVLNFIKLSSPLYTMQIAIPNSERKRLVTSYINAKKKISIAPDLIIIEKNSFIKKYKIDVSQYCSLKGFNSLKVYIKRDKNYC